MSTANATLKKILAKAKSASKKAPVKKTPAKKSKRKRGETAPRGPNFIAYDSTKHAGMLGTVLGSPFVIDATKLEEYSDQKNGAIPDCLSRTLNNWYNWGRGDYVTIDSVDISDHETLTALKAIVTKGSLLLAALEAIKVDSVNENAVPTSLAEVSIWLSTLGADKHMKFELKIGPNYYHPCFLSYRYNRNMWGGEEIRLSASLIDYEDQSYHYNSRISQLFLSKKLTIAELLHEIGFRLNRNAGVMYNNMIDTAGILYQKNGSLCNLYGPYVESVHGAWMNILMEKTGGSLTSPIKVIVDSKLETSTVDKDNNQTVELGWVRCFNLATRSWVYAKTAYLKNYSYDASVRDKLVISEERKNILDKLLRADLDKGFRDIISSKSGGIIVMCSGPTGVGKTLTAECFSEALQRPLYIMSATELGTNSKDVEANLDLALNRVTAWGAILLLDEADVFLRRRGEDIERSALVGVFLRKLDYYQGFMFLTTNLPEELDLAVLSRVTVHFRYNKLDAEARASVWANLLASAGMHSDEIKSIAEVDINGRQIRSIVRILSLTMTDTKHITRKDVDRATCLTGHV